MADVFVASFGPVLRVSPATFTPCRHVILPKELAKSLRKGVLLAEEEWRGVGVQQSRGWVHYACHRPEPHILLFRRPLGTDPTTGKVNPELARKAAQRYAEQFAEPTGAGAGAGAGAR